MTKSEAIARIVLRLKEGRLLPFVGAGVSCWPEATHVSNLRSAIRELPTEAFEWERAITAARTAASKSKDSKGLPDSFTLNNTQGWPPTWFLRLCMLALLNSTDRDKCGDLGFSALAQFLKCGPLHVDLANLLLAFFHPRGRFCGKPNKLHHLIAQLPCHSLVTTNYDSGIEEASQHTPRPLLPVIDDESLIDQGIEGRRIFKLHGDLSGYNRSIVKSHGADDILQAIVFPEDTYWQFPGVPHQVRSRNLLCKYVSALLPLSQVHEIFRHVGQWPKDHEPLLVVTHESSAAMVDFWQARRVSVVEVDDLESFIKEINAQIWQPLGRQLKNEVNGEIHDPFLALGVQHVLDLVQNEKDKTAVVGSLVELAHFSAAMAKHLGLGIILDSDLQPLRDLGWLRIVSNEADSEPLFYAFDLDLRNALRKWSSRK
jgi:hypothetical protein